MGTVIAVSNQKGGVGKTTITGNLGIGLAKAGKRVLLIDFDPQADLTSGLGFDTDTIEYCVAHALIQIINENHDFDAQEGILQHAEGVYLLPANDDMFGLETAMSNAVGISREKILSQYIAMVRDSYDYIFVDCNPSLGLLTINAFAAVDSVIIPIQPQKYSIKALKQLTGSILRTQKNFNPGVSIMGAVFNMVDDRLVLHKEFMGAVRDGYGKRIRIFDTNIPRSVRAEEAPNSGGSIFVHDPDGKVALAYTALVQEVL